LQFTKSAVGHEKRTVALEYLFITDETYSLLCPFLAFIYLRTEISFYKIFRRPRASLAPGNRWSASKKTNGADENLSTAGAWAPILL
jgi:hypothetical protein